MSCLCGVSCRLGHLCVVWVQERMQCACTVQQHGAARIACLYGRKQQPSVWPPVCGDVAASDMQLIFLGVCQIVLFGGILCVACAHKGQRCHVFGTPLPVVYMPLINQMNAESRCCGLLLPLFGLASLELPRGPVPAAAAPASPCTLYPAGLASGGVVVSPVGAVAYPAAPIFL